MLNKNHIMLRSTTCGQGGTFAGISFHGGIEEKIVKNDLQEKDDPVQYFDGANKAIGIIFLKFSALEEMLDVIAHPERWIKVLVE